MNRKEGTKEKLLETRIGILEFMDFVLLFVLLQLFNKKFQFNIIYMMIIE